MVLVGELFFAVSASAAEVVSTCHRAFASDQSHLTRGSLTWFAPDGGDRCCDNSTVPSWGYTEDWCGVLGKNKKFHPKGKIEPVGKKCWFRALTKEKTTVEVEGKQWTCNKNALPLASISAPCVREPQKAPIALLCDTLPAFCSKPSKSEPLKFLNTLAIPPPLTHGPVQNGDSEFDKLFSKH